MFAAAVFASYFAGRMGPGGRTAGAAILGLLYLAIVVLSRPITKGIHKLLSWEESGDKMSMSQRGVCFGSTLMFISTVVLAVSSLLTLGRMRTPPFFIGLLLAFTIFLLVGRHLIRGLQYLIQGDSKGSISQSPPADQTARHSTAFDGSSLPAGQGTPVPLFSAHTVTTAEIVAPSSITEHTTNLLENK
jgi:hypothetical protein